MHRLFVLLHAVLCLGAAGQASAGEANRGRPGVWVGVAAGAFFPLGSWAEHPYAGTVAPAGLRFFGPGGGAGLDAGLSNRRWAASLRFDFTNLATGAWEAFARDQGEEIASHGYLLAIHVGGFYRIVNHRWVYLDLGLGLGYVQGLGSETDEMRGLDYDYTFFSPTLSTRQSLVVGFRLTRWSDLVLLLDHTISPLGGVEYGGEEWARRIWGLTVAMGVRFWALRSKE